MNLIEEIANQKKEFKTDSYPMSIGEIINIYNHYCPVKN